MIEKRVRVGNNQCPQCYSQSVTLLWRGFVKTKKGDVAVYYYKCKDCDCRFRNTEDNRK